jgi:hypothetical protein
LFLLWTTWIQFMLSGPNSLGSILPPKSGPCISCNPTGTIYTFLPHPTCQVPRPFRTLRCDHPNNMKGYYSSKRFWNFLLRSLNTCRYSESLNCEVCRLFVLSHTQQGLLSETDTTVCHISHICPNWTIITATSQYKFMASSVQLVSCCLSQMFVHDLSSTILRSDCKVNFPVCGPDWLDVKLTSLNLTESKCKRLERPSRPVVLQRAHIPGIALNAGGTMLGRNQHTYQALHWMQAVQCWDVTTTRFSLMSKVLIVYRLFVCASLPVCPSFRGLSVRPHIHLSIRPSVCLSFHPCVYLSVLSMYFSIHLSKCRYVSFQPSVFTCLVPELFVESCRYVNVFLAWQITFNPRPDSWNIFRLSLVHSYGT